jgi:GNAT superfamily N-acetyltransferase
MRALYFKGITVQQLRNGDTETVATVFERLSDESRRRRFGGPKPRLSTEELAFLARVDGAHHVLVAYVDGDRRPAGLARLVRIGRRSAEVAFEVADEHQGRGVGSALARVLGTDARAAGIVELQATVTGEHHQAAALLARTTRRLRSTWSAGECRLVAVLD